MNESPSSNDQIPEDILAIYENLPEIDRLNLCAELGDLLRGCHGFDRADIENPDRRIPSSVEVSEVGTLMKLSPADRALLMERYSIVLDGVAVFTTPRGALNIGEDISFSR